MDFSESLDWLYSTQTFGMKLGLENPKRLLREYLAYPPNRTKVIHVAGTNGKGSTCALIDSVARAMGVRTGLFTSPHLMHYSERVRVAGVPISEDEIAGHLTALRHLVDGWDPHPTFFELTLALAMKHFAERQCELLVLETGLGGRLDATTAVPADVAVLTSIGLDHQQWLGDTLEEIAEEKAAIIVPRKPTFSARQDPAARLVIQQVANERRSDLEFVDEPLRGYAVGLGGDHQKENAALALAALHATHPYGLSYDTVKAGLGGVHWPGRFETVSRPNPANPAATLVLDVAHNEPAARALVANWQRAHGDQKANLFFGAVEGKDISGMLRALLPIAERIHFVPVNSSRALSPSALRDLLPDDHPSVELHKSLEEALDTPIALPSLVTGSAFLIGEVKALIEKCVHRASSQ